MLKKYCHYTNGVTLVGADHSPPVEGCQASPDGVVHSPPVEGCQASPDGVVHSPPVEGCQASPDGVVHSPPVEGCQASPDGVVHSPPVEGCQAPPDGVVHSPPVEGCQASPDGVVVACLHKPNRPRHPIMVAVNEMDRMDCLYRRNALRVVCVNLVAQGGWNGTSTVRSGGYINPPLPVAVFFNSPK